MQITSMRLLLLLLISLIAAACSPTSPDPTPRPRSATAPADTNIAESIELPDSYEAFLVQVGRPTRGEVLFNTFQEEAGFACSTCHRHDSEQRLIGPGLLNIAERAATRVEGVSAEAYLYSSIIAPGEFVVESFPDGLMPQNWAEIYSVSDISDIMAYLVTLEGESDAVAAAESAGEDSAAPPPVVENAPIELPATADAARGAELFQTFQPAASYACSTCHRNNTEDRLIGPGLLNVGARAEARVTGANAIQYLYTSIVSPDSYLVEGFPDTLMPENWAEIYSEEDIYDIIAYLLTLNGSQP